MLGHHVPETVAALEPGNDPEEYKDMPKMVESDVKDQQDRLKTVIGNLVQVSTFKTTY